MVALLGVSWKRSRYAWNENAKPSHFIGQTSVWNDHTGLTLVAAIA